MKHPEGLRISLAEKGMLDGSGVLKSSQGSPAAFGLTEEAVTLFLLIAAGGDTGVSQNKLPPELRSNLTEALIPLEMQGLVDWERDNRGRKMFLVLTWQGRDALESARTKPTDQATWASRRKASVTPAGVPVSPTPTSASRAPSDAVVADGMRRRAAFTAVDSVVVSALADTPGTSSSQNEGAGAFTDAEGFASEMAIGDLADQPVRRLRRRATCKADDDLLSTLACGTPEDTLMDTLGVFEFEE